MDAAATAARRILALHGSPERLARASVDGAVSDAPATLEDVGDLANGLLRLAIATGDAHWAVTARELVDSALTPDGAFALPGDPVLAAQGVVVGMDPTDGALPSGPSALAKACQTLSLLNADSRYRDAAATQIASVAGLAAQQPLGFGTALEVASALQAPVTQLVVVSPRVEPVETAPNELVVTARHQPRGLAIAVTDAQASAFADEGFSLFEAKTSLGGIPAAYACTDFVCQLPVTDVAALRHPGDGAATTPR